MHPEIASLEEEKKTTFIKYIIWVLIETSEEKVQYYIITISRLDFWEW